VTGPEHYRRAEELLAEVEGLNPRNEESRAVMTVVQGRAQAHATLALAAATALPVTRVLLAAEYQAWADVAAVKTEPEA
jgi:hypothetical protein